MRITRTQLRRIIREEKAKLDRQARLSEAGALDRGMQYLSKNVLQNPDEWKDDPVVQEVVAAGQAAKSAGIPVGVVVDFIKRAMR